jgi:hypothetical protein
VVFKVTTLVNPAVRLSENMPAAVAVNKKTPTGPRFQNDLLQP